MKQLTEAQFIHDAQLLAATHTEEETIAIYHGWCGTLFSRATYIQHCAARALEPIAYSKLFLKHFRVVKQSYAKEQK
jgi:hypothetical protein